MMMEFHPLLEAWTAQVLSFRLDGSSKTAQDCALLPGVAGTGFARALRLMQAAGRSRLLLCGADEALLPHLDTLPVPFLLVETRLEHARRLLAMRPGLPLLADTSPWALLLLLAATNWMGEAVQPLLTGALPREHALPRLVRLLQAVHPLAIPHSPLHFPASRAGLSLAAILHPEEPDLAGFFSQLPPWLAEVALVWDAPDLADLQAVQAQSGLHALPCPVRQLAHPLTDGFHRQRNRALSLCTGDWVLFLDADERLPPEAWAALPALMATPSVAGWWLPRETLHPDAAHCLMGYGLWPDLQLRLFRRQDGLHFSGAVHERLQGLTWHKGDPDPITQAIACRVHIRHEQRLRKTPEALTAKLARFDAFAAGTRHRLQQDYPVMPRATLHSAMELAPQALRLPCPPGA
ncbi:MAG: glycosyltransferase [Desulfovibrio sp.]|nr:glycosyltransferase [Desulfovibrio sp.]MCA1986805.1 glycosyltransferase [Desulfovibrio sp.]